jgi:hypothetical protein
MTTLINVQTTSAVNSNLSTRYPMLIKQTAFFDPELGEIRSKHVCDLPGMRANQAFRNQASSNADRYDAYVRDGLAPWIRSFDKVHGLVDEALGIGH